ncbi:MAG: glycosyltransferase family 39 protein [Candidatus Zixiibacteriota bacterium]|nr:MAG: glycosyltransferase family 39 protein [candidate division Zixibacteria bacterium]
MLSPSRFRQIVSALFVLNIALRLIFIIGTEQVPVMWDARLYSSAGLGLIHYAGHPDRFGHPEDHAAADSAFYRSQFEHTMAEFIEGEQIRWLYYDKPTVAEAQEYIFLSGPVYPMYLAGVFLFDVGGDFTLVRLLNILLDSLCLLLVMLIAKELFDRRAAILVGVIYLFYLPFVLYTGLVSPDLPTSLFMLLAYYLVLMWYKREKRSFIYLSGLMLGLLVLTKPTAVLLWLPFAAAFLYDNRKTPQQAMAVMAKALIPFLLVVLPWLILTSLYFGKFSIRDPQYSEANIRSSSSIKYEGYDLDYVDQDFWLKSVPYIIKEDPLGYAGLLVKKFIRLWSQPYNDFDRSFILTKSSGRLLHLVLIITGLFGVLLFAVNDKRGLVLLLFIPVYYTVLHLIFHSLGRYNFNAMPIVIIASAAVIIKTADFIGQAIKSSGPFRAVAPFVLTGVGGAFVLSFPERHFVVLFGGTFGTTFLLVIKILVLTAVMYYIVRSILRRAGRKAAVRIAGFPAVLFLLILISRGSAAPTWVEWKCRLQNPGQSAGVVLYVPGNFRLQPGELVRIVIDMVTGENMAVPFNLTVNGRRDVFQVDQPPVSGFYYKKGTYDIYEEMLEINRGRMRAWRFIPFDPVMFNDLLDRFGFIDINFSVADSLSAAGGFIDLFGNFKISGAGTVLIPDLTHSSIERFVEKGDPRIWTEYKISSDSVISYYIDDVRRKVVRTDDLSQSPGRQSGRYRIFIEVKRFDETRYYF